MLIEFSSFEIILKYFIFDILHIKARTELAWIPSSYPGLESIEVRLFMYNFNCDLLMEHSKFSSDQVLIFFLFLLWSNLQGLQGYYITINIWYVYLNADHWIFCFKFSFHLLSFLVLFFKTNCKCHNSMNDYFQINCVTVMQTL